MGIYSAPQIFTYSCDFEGCKARREVEMGEGRSGFHVVKLDPEAPLPHTGQRELRAVLCTLHRDALLKAIDVYGFTWSPK